MLKGMRSTCKIWMLLDIFMFRNFELLKLLEVRGNSQRLLHYKGFINGKRVYEKHKVVRVNGNKPMGINKSLYSFFKEKQRARSSARLERRTLNP